MKCMTLPLGVREPACKCEDTAGEKVQASASSFPGERACAPDTPGGDRVCAPDTPGGHSTETPTTATCPSESEETEPDSDSDNGHHFSPEDTLIIFDWDDTVFPSTWVKEQIPCTNGTPTIAPWQQECLAELAHLAEETLVLAKQLGTVLLVTNAEQGWIDLSCQNYMPALLPALADVRALSARTVFETPNVFSPYEWKRRAFESEIERAFLSDLSVMRRKNIISLGDSLHEREALMTTTECLPNCRTKSLKFVERPGINQLCKQHMFVASCLRRIVHHDGNLDLHVRETLG